VIRSACCFNCGARVEIRHYSGKILCNRCRAAEDERIREHNKNWEKKREGKK